MKNSNGRNIRVTDVTDVYPGFFSNNACWRHIMLSIHGLWLGQLCVKWTLMQSITCGIPDHLNDVTSVTQKKAKIDSIFLNLNCVQTNCPISNNVVFPDRVEPGEYFNEF